MSETEIQEMRETHEDILRHRRYPPEIEQELRDAMADWLSKVKRK